MNGKEIMVAIWVLIFIFISPLISTVGEHFEHIYWDKIWEWRKSK